ncbi:MAG TPA: glycoside hydrolase family 130 protein [Desulfomonilaceae bacterium]|nr:glycoside hydrolase family 130 protein [Desulfomonilaceae bacterium]
MTYPSKRDLVHRYEGNPIVTKHDVPYAVETVHNAAMTKFGDEYIMVFRSHLRNGRSILGLARSDDGFHFRVDPQPFMVPSKSGIFAEYEEFGIEDPRICLIEGRFLITYSAYSKHGVRIGLAATTDFVSLDRIALITQADYRNAVIFPKRFAGRFARLDRPHTEISPWSIWISYSPDLIHWGDSKVIMGPAQYHWDQMKIGPGATPFETAAGWLHIYHGVFQTMDGAIYRLGVALHDIDDPSRILGIADDWILQPEQAWEVAGYVHNVVFTCGAIPETDGTVKIYWGGADTVMCVGTAIIDDLVDLCLKNPRKA